MGGEIIHEIRITGVCFAFPAVRMELWAPAAAAGVCVSRRVLGAGRAVASLAGMLCQGCLSPGMGHPVCFGCCR